MAMSVRNVLGEGGGGLKKHTTQVSRKKAAAAGSTKTLVTSTKPHGVTSQKACIFVSVPLRSYYISRRPLISLIK
jgi:hypothetical protein